MFTVDDGLCFPWEGFVLSNNDLNTIQAALDTGMETVMTRTLGDFRITVSTSRAPPVWHPFLMLARLEIWDGHIYSTKWCVSAEEVQQFAGR